MRALVERGASLGAFGLLLFLIVWLPIPWGSNRTWSSLLIVALTSVILILWCVSRLFSSLRDSRDDGRYRLGWYLMSLWLAYLCLQVTPLPPEWLKAISPSSYDAYRAARGDFLSLAYLSLDISSTRFEILKYATFITLFGLTWSLVNSGRRVTVLIMTFFAAGLMESVLGIGLWSAGKSLVPHSLSQGHWSRVTGSFVNRNHFACHLAMTFCTGIGFLIMKQGLRLRASDARAFTGSFLDSVLNGRFLIVVALIIMFCALLLSGSVGGFVALLVTLLSLVLLVSGNRTAYTRLGAAIGLAVIVVAFAALFTGGGVLWSRMVQGDITLSNRLEQWYLTWRMFLEYPWFGVGAGNYAVVFPGFQDNSLPALQYDHVHNDYLELLVNQGLFGFALFVSGVLFFVGKIFNELRNITDHLEFGALFASLAGMMVMFVHSMVEFNFYIPANAIYLFILLGLGMSVVQMNAERDGKLKL